MAPWPNLYLVGAAKCGTTSIHEYLAGNADICMSDEKEPHYFSADKIENLGYPGMCLTEEDYHNLFTATGCRVIGESSTTYLPLRTVAERIKEKSPDARIIVSLRDPVDRAFSHYLMLRRSGKVTQSFDDVIEQALSYDIIDSINLLHIYPYAEAVRCYIELFGLENVMILTFEEWVKDVPSVMRSIGEFIGVGSIDASTDQSVHNAYYERHPVARALLSVSGLAPLLRKVLPSGIRSSINKTFFQVKADKPVLSQTAIIKLQMYYKDDVKAIADIVGHDFPWRHFNSAKTIAGRG